MGVAVSAHRLLQSRDCIVPNCVHEAENGADRCRNHLEWKPGDAGDESLLGALTGVAGVDVVAPEPVEAGTCKVDGCTRPHNTSYRRGIFAKLCPAHMEEARERASRRTKGGAAPVSKPEPAPSVPGDDGFEARAQRLVDAGRLVDETRRGLAAAHAHAAQIVEEANAAIQAAQDEWLRLLAEETHRPDD